LYLTSPWGFDSSNLFFNLLLVGKTFLSPWALLFEIKKIEFLIGRKPKKTKEYEDRIIDIDIIFYENEIIEGSALTIPHPRAHQRGFVIIPALELIPEWIHPVLKKSVREIYKENEEKFKQENLKILKSEVN
jgi:2-amino-4-hydroxy-6-hydroxymethyldihydropteridine diphosphokinase